ncbi:phosphatidylinositol N-acetylglucosaminyltransferase subunit H-like [Amphiura filiformis]|uniref:phosphatidylinositol N-acetylglucosaminyltransferase subunit H-like n=1 Tax=Amphiura filiformis TaxID=82378 RepID=UPI003B221FD0
MYTCNESLLVKQVRNNINGGKVIFKDRYCAGPDNETLVTELSIQPTNDSVLGSITLIMLIIVMALIALPCFYSIWIIQNQMFTYIGFILVMLSCLIYLHFFNIKKEILTIIRCTGVQLTTIYATGRKQIQFVDVHNIENIVINEAVSMHKIIYYLAIILRRHPKTEQDHIIIPVFLHSMPRLDTLTDIYQTIHECLWKEPATINDTRT